MACRIFRARTSASIVMAGTVGGVPQQKWIHATRCGKFVYQLVLYVILKPVSCHDADFINSSYNIIMMTRGFIVYTMIGCS